MENSFRISNDIASAETLTSNFYTDDDVFESSKETIFARSWQLITHTKNLKKHNILNGVNKITSEINHTYEKYSHKKLQ